MTRFSHGVFVTFFTQTAILLLTLGANIIITRTIGPEGKGILTLITNFFLILVTIFTFGLSEGVVYLLSSRKYKHAEVFSSIMYATVFTSILLVCLSFVLKNWIVSSFLKNVGVQNYLVALFIFPAFYFFLNLRKILLGHNNLLAYNVLILFQSLLLVLLYLFLIPAIGVMGGVISIIVSLVLVDISGSIYVSSHYGGPAHLPNIGFLKAGFIFGIKSQIGIVLSFFDRRLDVFIINIFLNPISVGFYAIAVALAELPWRISDAVGTVLFPRVAGISRKDAIRLVTQACRNTLFVTAVTSLALFLIAGVIIRLLFGTDFLQSLPALQVLLPGIVALSLNRVLCGGFSGLGRPEYGTYTVISSSICTVILDLIFIPKMGIVGAALASSIAYCLSALAAIIIFQRISKCNLINLLMISKHDIARYVTLFQNPLQRK